MYIIGGRDDDELDDVILLYHKTHRIRVRTKMNRSTHIAFQMIIVASPQQCLHIDSEDAWRTQTTNKYCFLHENFLKNISHHIGCI